jgi:hypothetical protein
MRRRNWSPKLGESAASSVGLPPAPGVVDENVDPSVIGDRLSASLASGSVIIDIEHRDGYGELLKAFHMLHARIPKPSLSADRMAGASPMWLVAQLQRDAVSGAAANPC